MVKDTLTKLIYRFRELFRLEKPFRLLHPAISIPPLVVLSTIIYLENEIFNFLLCLINLHFTLQYFNLRDAEKSCKAKKMEKAQIRVALKQRNSAWSSCSVNRALPHWSEDCRINQRKGTLKLRKWATKKARKCRRSWKQQLMHCRLQFICPWNVQFQNHVISQYC